jgi:hypothetical protein
LQTSVTTKEFASQNGGCHTRAARAITEHAAFATGGPQTYGIA